LADTGPDAFGNYARDQTPTSRKRNKSEPNRIDQGALFELAVFAAPAVEPDSHWTAIKRRLTPNAGPDSGKHTAARFRDFITAFQAMGLSLTNRHARPRSQDPVYHGIVDLILHRPVPGPPARHSRFPVSLTSQGHHIGLNAARSKDGEPRADQGPLWPKPEWRLWSSNCDKQTFVQRDCQRPPSTQSGSSRDRRLVPGKTVVMAPPLWHSADATC
jgi:hypothetical protein